MAEDVYEIILDFIKPGVSEKEIATEIAYQSRKLGSEGDPFDIIVVSGNRGALVHGTPSDKKIKKNELVLMDFGCIVNGFGSDITRTVAVGKATKEQQKLYKLLRDAEVKAMDEVRPGMKGANLDAIARDMIKDAGFGDNFQHSLGHGIGLVAHEMPIITFRKEDQIVPEDCVLAIEPGVYIPDKFGIRVEDNILVTRNGGERLTNAPDELPVI
ncbi:MAG: M24 family metallopeptidase [Candidatus Kapaibacterium sp.]